LTKFIAFNQGWFQLGHGKKRGRELSFSRPPRLAPITSRISRIFRQENDSWLRMVLHQEPSPTSFGISPRSADGLGGLIRLIN
jgi:hypothetical protein